MLFSNHKFHIPNKPLLQRFKANISHPEHWRLTGKLTGEVKVGLLWQFPADKDKSCRLLSFYDAPQVITWSVRKDMVSLIIPSDMPIVSSCPVSAPTSFSLKKWPWAEMRILFPHQRSSLISDAIQAMYQKQDKMPQPSHEGLHTEDHPNSCFFQGRRSNSCFLDTRGLGQAA